MKISAFALTALIGLGMAFLSTSAKAQCANPPKSKEGQCAKDNGGKCEFRNGKYVWWTYNMKAYNACLAGKLTKQHGYRSR